MLELSSKIIEFAVNIALSIIAAYIYDWLKGKNSSAPYLVMANPPPEQVEVTTRKHSNFTKNVDARDIDRFRRRLWQLTFFVLTVFYWWASIQITVGIATLSLDERSAKFMTITALTAILYPLVIFCSDQILSLSNWLLRWFDSDSIEDWLVARAMVLFPVSMICSAAIALVFFNASSLAAILVPISIILIVMGKVGATRSKTKRPPNTCRNCNNQWFPRGKNKSSICPECKSRSVSIDYFRQYGQDILMLFCFGVFLIAYIYFL